MDKKFSKKLLFLNLKWDSDLPKASFASSKSAASCNFFTLSFSASCSSGVSSSFCNNRCQKVKIKALEMTKRQQFVYYIENCKNKQISLDPPTVSPSAPAVFSLTGFLSLLSSHSAFSFQRPLSLKEKINNKTC